MCIRFLSCGAAVPSGAWNWHTLPAALPTRTRRQSATFGARIGAVRELTEHLLGTERMCRA